MKNEFKKGFTLVELSIVLVIIGLLIGGILVGQSLIESAKMQSFIRKVGQYDAAVGLFDDKFGNLPGDNGLFGTTCSGTCVDGDGTISSTALLVPTLFNGEVGAFWADLAASGLKNENGNGGSFDAIRDAATTAPLLNTHLPEADVGTNTGIYAYGIGGANFYYVGANTANTLAFDGGIKPADAIAIDAKLDDGSGFEGDVFIVDSGVTALPTDSASDLGTSANIDGTPGTAACYSAVDVINAALDDEVCQVRIRIGSATGVLQ